MKVLLIAIYIMVTTLIYAQKYDDVEYPYYSEMFGLYLDENQVPIYHPEMDWSQFRYRAFRYYEYMDWNVPRYLYLGTPPNIYYKRYPYWRQNNWNWNRYYWNRYHPNPYPKYYNHNHYKFENKNKTKKYYNNQNYNKPKVYRSRVR